MAVLPASAGREDDALASSSRPAAPTPEVASRADGVELIGEMVGSGYREPPALARRGDGQTFQLTPLLYLVLETVDGRRSFDEVAERVSAAYGRTVTPDNVRTLVDQQLRPMGLLARPDGSQPEVKKSNPLLALRFKYAVTDPERTRRLTAPFARLFNPVVVVAVMVAFAAVCWWVFMEKGLASATYQAFDKPGLLLLVVAITILSAGFHEFGHAAAARRGGATPGVMGAGIYLVWPAFYTDVTDSYRLGRGGRVRTDLGGLYFNAIVAVAVAGVWWLTGYDALLLLVATQILQMVRQLTPLVRFDGYHVLADLTGVPDLFHRIKPTLLGVLPWRWKHPETRVLKPWARAVVTLWVVVVVPMLAFSLFTMVLTLPRILGTARASVEKQSTLLGRAWSDTDLLEAAARCIAIVAVAFPILAIAVILVRLVRKIVGSTWRRTRGRPVRRGLAGLVAAALVAGLAWAWWPHPGTYRPIEPYEGGTLVQAAQALPVVPRSAPTRLVEGQRGSLVTGWSDDDPRPTRSHPQLALVLIPRDGGATSAHGRRRGLRGRRRRRRTGRRHERRHRRQHGRRGPAVGVPVQQAARPRRRRQPGDGGQHQRQHHPLRRGVRAGVGRGRLPRAEHQRGLRVRELHQLRGGRDRLPDRPGHRRQPRRRAAEHLGRGQLRLRQLPHLCARHPALRDPRRPAQRRRPAADRGAVAADRRLRHAHHGGAALRGARPADVVRAADPGRHREGAGAADARTPPPRPTPARRRPPSAESSDGAAPSAEASPGAGTPSDSATGTTGGSTGDAGSTGGSGRRDERCDHRHGPVPDPDGRADHTRIPHRARPRRPTPPRSTELQHRQAVASSACSTAGRCGPSTRRRRWPTAPRP